MANITDRKPENRLGRFYVDDSCIDCDICRNHAPAFFQRHDDSGQSIVYRQPVTADEVALALEALESCPSESIGADAVE